MNFSVKKRNAPVSALIKTLQQLYKEYRLWKRNHNRKCHQKRC